MSINKDEFITFGKNIQTNCAELLNLISNKNVINKALLLRPSTYNGIPNNDKQNEKDSSQLSIDEIDEIFEEWDKLEMKVIGKPKRNKIESKPSFIVPNNATIIGTNKRNNTTLHLGAFRKSCENLTVSSFFNVMPLHSTPLASSSSSLLSANNLTKTTVTEELLQNVDDITNKKQVDISKLIDNDKRIFDELMENIEKLKQFLDNLEAGCLTLLTETGENKSNSDCDNHANEIDTEFCKRLKSINEIFTSISFLDENYNIYSTEMLGESMVLNPLHDCIAELVEKINKY